MLPFLGLKSVNKDQTILVSVLFNMNSLASVLETRSPLFSHISIPRRSAPTHIVPILPRKLKFVVSPNTDQVLVPGLYYQIPEGLLFSEMEELEQAILAVFPDYENKALDIPDTLARKLGPSCSPMLNGFKTHKGRCFVESANCLFVSPRASLLPTSLYKPSYGAVVPLKEAACCLSFLASSVSLYRCGKQDTTSTMLARTWKKLVTSSNVNMKQAQLKDETFSIGTEEFFDLADGDCIHPGVSALLSSFFWLETDLSEHLEW